ncbi:MAG: GNAT family protein [Leucobacter sp.]
MAPLGRPIEVPPPLRAGAVTIRPIRVADASRLEQLLQDNRHWLVRWEATHPSGRGPEPGSVSMRPTIRLLRRQFRSGTGAPFVIEYGGEVVGQLSASEISGGALCSAQIGYWVSEHVAGRGVTPVAVALAIDYLFGALQLHRVEICIRPENAASLRVVEKLGLRYEGRRHAYINIDGAWRDHDCFAITAEEAQGSLINRLPPAASH